MNDTKVIEFLKRLLHPEDLGWAVSNEVRMLAKKLLDELTHDTT